MARLQAVDAIVIKLVAIGRDRIHQRLQRHVAGISRWAPTADAAAHQDCPCQDRRRLFDQFLSDLIWPRILGHTCQQSVERHLANHEPIVVAIQIDVVGIPLAKNIIRPAVNRMIKVVRSRVKRQLHHPIRIERSGSQNRRIGRTQRLNGSQNDVVIGTIRHARPGDVQRHGTNPFAGIRRTGRFIQQRYRSIADIIVQPRHRFVNDPPIGRCRSRNGRL